LIIGEAPQRVFGQPICKVSYTPGALQWCDFVPMKGFSGAMRAPVMAGSACD
jgi:hypothetical protein